MNTDSQHPASERSQSSNNHERDTDTGGGKPPHPERIPITYVLNPRQEGHADHSLSKALPAGEEAAGMGGVFVHEKNSNAHELPEVEIRWTPPTGLSLGKDYPRVLLNLHTYSFTLTRKHTPSMAGKKQVSYIFLPESGQNKLLTSPDGYAQQLTLIVPENAPVPATISVLSRLYQLPG